jgi:2-haloacid dehalogenase
MADAWRRAYQPSMDRVRRRAIPWTILDDLHRDSLVDIARRFDVGPLADADCDHLVRLWHRLAPWPDVVAGLTALKRHCIIGPLSNGHVALQVALATTSPMPRSISAPATIWAWSPPR